MSFGVPDYAVRRLRLGQQFSIHLQDDPKEYNGRVTSIAASADEKNRVFAIEVTVAQPKSVIEARNDCFIQFDRRSQRLRFPPCLLAPLLPTPLRPDAMRFSSPAKRAGNGWRICARWHLARPTRVMWQLKV